jgi:hypothetical protein
MNNPAAYLKEIQKFLVAVSPRSVLAGISTISDELARLGFTYKKMWYFSNKRDEADRINFICNYGDDPIRPGVCCMDVFQAVDLDEAGYYTSRATRPMGHGFKGRPARTDGRAKRGR